MNIVQLINKKREEAKYKKMRLAYIMHHIANIGKIVEDDYEITCYVTQDLVDKNGKEIFYKLRCNGFNKNIPEVKKLLEYYKLNKTVFYIFDNIVFDVPVEITSHFAHLVFKNCTFKNGIATFWADDISLHNNKYINWSNTYSYGNSFFFGRNIKKLTFSNDNFINSYELKGYETTKFGMDIRCNKLNIIDSNIQAENNGQININASSAILFASTISGTEIYLDSDVINCVDASIKPEKGIIIENKNNDMEACIENIECPYIVYNGTEIKSDNHKYININKDKALLDKKRQELVHVLKQIKDECETINNKKIDKMKTNLEKQTLKKIKKGN